MLFDIEIDRPDRVSGWIVPDHPSAQPVVAASSGGGLRLRILAGEGRPDLVRRRLHATGLCGFRLDAATWPALRDASDIQLHEERSNILVYRRMREPGLPVRLFQLETQSLPFYPLAGELSPHVRMVYSGCETIGEESLAAILTIGFTDSIFVSGAIAYRRYEPYLRERAFRRIVLLCDPLREPAARILRLKACAGEPPGSWRTLGQGRLVQAFAEVDAFDRRSLTRCLRGLSDEDFLWLANPLTRLLGGAQPWEVPGADQAGAALDSLSQFDVVGFDDDLSGFAASLGALTGRPSIFTSRPNEPAELMRAVHALGTSPLAGDLVDLDQSVVGLARGALAAG